MNTKPETSSSLESSLLKEVSYDPFMSVLSICFNNGGVYEYIDVPEKVYNELIAAPSAGKFFHNNIKYNFQFLRRK